MIRSLDDVCTTKIKSGSQDGFTDAPPTYRRPLSAILFAVVIHRIIRGATVEQGKDKVIRHIEHRQSPLDSHPKRCSYFPDRIRR